ncbi:MAG: neutral/alkaline non-lysosomal ceramidase N-terminal domain-containing protein [Planctomycetaceae bacterium]|nr:neutral/alkaline non-lysosomal ceramidase N-terminal domain-containing protein [Planctomycetaceae bacterium]
MKLRFPLVCFSLFLLSGLQIASAEEAVWKAGSAFVRITPDKPMYMAGYAARNKPSEGVASELYAKALYLEDAEGHRAAIVTFDLISVLKELRDGVAKTVEARYKIPAAAVMLNCSHTHCGPVVRSPSKAIQDLDSEKVKQAVEYSQWLEKTLIELVGAAVENAEPSTVTYHRSRAAFAMNRRLPTDAGFRNSPNPDGPVDHDVPVLKVVNAAGELKTILFGYACHNTTLSFYEFCGDYAGFAQADIERNHPGVVAMFVMGCGGDQNPYPRRTLDLAITHGKTLATAVEAALETPAIPVSGPLTAQLEEVEVTYAPPPTKEELEARLETGNKYVVRHAQRLLTQLETEGKLRDSYTTLVQTFQFGDDLTLIALPGETVVDFSLRLKRELADRRVWVAGYSNDVFAYVPSKRVLQEGGYEGGGALIYFTAILHPGPFADDIEERIIDSVHRQLQPE